MKKIAFCWYWNRAEEIYPNWRDGLRAALEELQKRGYTINIYGGEEVPKLQGEDWLFFWGDSDCPLFNDLDKFDCKKAIQLTTLPHNMDNLRKLDVVFCESNPVLQRVKADGIRAILGFGTDTNFFKPNDGPKTIPYFFPATFSPWKSQHLLTGLGSSVYCLGTIQPDGLDIYRKCEKAGVHLCEGYFKPEEILKCYQSAQQVIIPSIHGSERTVLEAMSCNILPHVSSLNPRANSYIEEFWVWLEQNYGKWTRDFVLERYSEKTYADALERGFGG